jgi:hypothetical protein
LRIEEKQGKETYEMEERLRMKIEGRRNRREGEGEAMKQKNTTNATFAVVATRMKFSGLFGLC